MGIKRLFGGNSTLNIATNMNLSMHDVAHKVEFKIDESGSVDIEHEECDEEPIEFFCDKPFAYMIYDSEAKRVLLFGIYRGNDIDVKVRAENANKAKKKKERQANHKAYKEKKEAEATATAAVAAEAETAE